MFSDSKFKGYISHWDLCNVENMSWMFEGSEFNGDISKWNTVRVGSMACMFDKSKIKYLPPWYKKSIWYKEQC
jgi:hypothetical protein